MSFDLLRLRNNVAWLWMCQVRTKHLLFVEYSTTTEYPTQLNYIIRFSYLQLKFDVPVYNELCAYFHFIGFDNGITKANSFSFIRSNWSSLYFFISDVSNQFDCFFSQLIYLNAIETNLLLLSVWHAKQVNHIEMKSICVYSIQRTFAST